MRGRRLRSQYLDGRLDATTASQATAIDTAEGPVWIGKAPWYDDPFMGQIDDARIYDKVLTAEEIQQVMLGDTKLAGNPVPERNALVDIRDISSLSWSRGDTAASHDVYFGRDRDAVAGADNSSPEFQGNQAGTSFSSAGLVEFGGGDYYWRVDEVQSDGTVLTGTIWKFTVPDYLTVEDFESYNDIPAGESGSNLVYVAWKDGYDNPNVNGSTMGYVTGVSMESGEVHGGGQSAPMGYNNATAGISEVTRNFTAAQDWTANGVTVLSLWFFGDPTNTSGQLYLKINGVQMNYTGDAANLSLAQWHRWDIDLTTVGTNLQSVNSLAIGVQDIGATGTLLLDDIALYRSVP